MYKALITDLDGTAAPLGSDGSDVDAETRNTIANAQAAGYLIACATGRSWDVAKPLVTALGLKDLCVISGGSVIINPVTEEILWETRLEPGSPQNILDIFKLHSKTGDLYASTPDNPYIARLEHAAQMPNIARVVYLMNIPLEEGQKIADDINKNLDKVIAHLTPSWEGADRIDVHVTHIDATKEHAIKAWHELTGVSMNETIGMGDSGNDMPLLNATGLKVGVANATEEVKAVVDYLAPAADDHAVKHVIDKFLLSQSQAA